MHSYIYMDGLFMQVLVLYCYNSSYIIICNSLVYVSDKEQQKKYNSLELSFIVDPHFANL